MRISAWSSDVCSADLGEETEIDLAEVAVGDRLRIRPGEAVPVDGVVIDGRSAVDESMLTGEPAPVEKTADAPLTAGTVNGTGSLVMEARAIGADTTQIGRAPV